VRAVKDMDLHFVVNGWSEPAKMRKKVIVLITVLLFFAYLTSFVSALPNGTETPITTQPTCSYLSEPAIYGDKIVWEDTRDPDTSQIYIYDLVTGEEYPVNSSQNFQYHPAIFEDAVVWTEPDFTGDISKIIRYNTTTRTRDEYPGHYDTGMYEYNYPKISGNTVVWQDYNTTTSSWDISAVAGSVPDLIIYGDGDQKHPEIYQNFIVYENWTGTAYNSPSDIWLYNLTNHTAVPISENFYQESLPHIHGEKIVWEASNLSGDGTHIHVYDHGVISRLTPLSSQPFDQVHPAIYGNHVVVEDARDSALHDVYAYDLVTGNEIRVSPKTLAFSQLNPHLNENRIVWADTRSASNNMDVYLFTLGPAVVCPSAGFSASPPYGSTGLVVTFADTSQGSPILHRTWDFGDSSPPVLNPVGPVTHQFMSAGIYPVKLAVGNVLCRNSSSNICKNKIFIDAPPEADFSAAPLYGFAPLTVRFKDISCGAPKSWIWDFGDGTTSAEKDPVHTFTQPGSAYTVSLTVNNTLGGGITNTKIQKDFIHTLIGSTKKSVTPVIGITTYPSYHKLFLEYNSSLLPSFKIITNNSHLISLPPEQYGWQTISFMSADSAGFAENANHTISGSFSDVLFHTGDLTATNLSYQIGMNYQFRDTTYPVQSVTTSEIWEGALPADMTEFEYFASLVPPTGFTSVSAVPFTAHVTKDPPFGQGSATINISISSSWYDNHQETPTTPVIIIGTGKDSQGNRIGAGLKPVRTRAGDIDYFVADVPGYLTNFGLAQVSGSGNPIQLITLTVASHIGSGEGVGEGSSKPVAVQNTAAPEIKPPIPPDPGKTAKIYSNLQGVISQATTLQSTDGLAKVTISEGIVAKDSSGKALSSITIKAIPADSVPAIPPGSAFVFNGMAYELQPDSATFSPAISISYTVPQARWGQDFLVKTFDTTSGTWQDIPTRYNASTGIVTAEVSHFCCFALFTKAVPPSPTITPFPAQLAPQVAAPPPPTAMSTFSGMVLWIVDMMTKNVLVIAGIVIVAVALFLYGRKRRRDRVMYLR